MKRFRALIFDFDGTLARVPLDFDLMRRKVSALAEGFLPERPVVNGQPVLELVEELTQQIREYRDHDEALEFHCRARLTITDMEIRAAKQGELFAYTRPVLGRLRDQDVAVGVISRNITPAVTTVFPDILDHVQVFIPRDEARKVKPHPDHLHQALEIVGVAPEHTLMVGDHPMDVQTGVRAGAAGAGVTTGHADKAGFRDAGALFVADDVRALVDMLCDKKHI
ncbi:HAD family hydrolase [Pseudodesulfovibrio senegalensis]|uniref:phosphoglycolate phosphatase n=1 Tax=Pseudodesulfovibrio senegalensis TaxID=1721087 RepID=A0A6N6MZE9_9BACT|nr:HAD-IA family hydrolase [Pseudodesulfovibrio senegalensis]KAB1439002.1 HAD family hydrolase [Pseudodesulfovibrio senegalensis]